MLGDLKYELIEVEGRSIRVATAETLYRLQKDTITRLRMAPASGIISMSLTLPKRMCLR